MPSLSLVIIGWLGRGAGSVAVGGGAASTVVEKEEAGVEDGMCGSGAKGNDTRVWGEVGYNGSEIGEEVAAGLGDLNCDVAGGWVAREGDVWVEIMVLVSAGAEWLTWSEAKPFVGGSEMEDIQS